MGRRAERRGTKSRTIPGTGPKHGGSGAMQKTRYPRTWKENGKHKRTADNPRHRRETEHPATEPT